MATRKVQITLNDRRKIDAEIMDHLKSMGTYSGEERILLVAGYMSLYGGKSHPYANLEDNTPEVEEKPGKTEEKRQPDKMIDDSVTFPDGMLAGG